MSSKNKPIRILFLHTGAELYGADQILLSIVTNLDKQKFKPIVILPNDGPLREELKKNQIATEIIPYPIIRRQCFTPVGIISYIKEFRRSIKILSALVKQKKIDIIHNNTIAVLEGVYLKRKLKLKLISHVHEMLDDPKIVAKFLYKIHLNNCDKMIAVSHAVKNHIENILKITSSKLVVIHNGIHAPKNEHNLTAQHKYYNEFNLPKTAKVVAIIGRINAIKGQNDFIESMSAIITKDNNIYGLIIGDAFSGQEWRINELREKIKEKGLEDRIIYCGFRKDVDKIYEIIDLLILSSVKYDSFPTVVLEAMSRGIPTVAYKCGGVEEMIENGHNGHLVKQGDVKEMSKKIEHVLANDNTLRIMQKQSKIFFKQHFTNKTFISNLQTQYEDLMK